MASGYTMRLFRHNTADISGISTISALGNADDPLSNYMCRNIRSQWTSFRLGCLRWMKSMVITPGAVCYIIEDSSSKEMLGWAIWTRHGTSDKAREWQRENEGLGNWIERKLLDFEGKYFEKIPNVNPTAVKANWNNLAPILHEEWPKDIFTEYWLLDGLYVHPGHFRKGIGRMLAVWGVEKGKEERVPVLVKASPDGSKLYKSVGFEVIRRESRFDVYIPDFKDGGDGPGCWQMGAQYEGGDEIEKCRRMYAKEGKSALEKGDEGEVAMPAEADSAT